MNVTRKSGGEGGKAEQIKKRGKSKKQNLCYCWWWNHILKSLNIESFPSTQSLMTTNLLMNVLIIASAAVCQRDDDDEKKGKIRNLFMFNFIAQKTGQLFSWWLTFYVGKSKIVAKHCRNLSSAMFDWCWVCLATHNWFSCLSFFFRSRLPRVQQYRTDQNRK